MKNQTPGTQDKKTEELDRRQFLKGTLAAAAPLIIPAHALGRDGAKPPSERLTCALIGCGVMGLGDAMQLYNRDEVQFLGFCDVDRDAREASKTRFERLYANRNGQPGYRGITAYHDFRELLSRENLDAVVVATPEHWHAIPVIAAAAAGKDIYCEKPLCYCVREGRAMVNAVRRHGRVLQTGSQQRSIGDFRFACELIRSGALGKVHTIYVRVGGTSQPFDDASVDPVPDGFDYNFWVGPAPWRPFSSAFHPRRWRAFREFAGGGVSDWGAHHFDIVQWALGMDGSGPVEFIPPNGQDVPFMTFRYASGTAVHHIQRQDEARVNWPSPPQGDEYGITFIGEKGWIEVDRSHIRTFPANLVTLRTRLQKVDLHPGRPAHHANFLECIRTRQDPVANVEVGCRSANISQLVNIAYWTGRPFRWDPEKEELMGDEEQKSYLSRVYREPWHL